MVTNCGAHRATVRARRRRRQWLEQPLARSYEAELRLGRGRSVRQSAGSSGSVSFPMGGTSSADQQITEQHSPPPPVDRPDSTVHRPLARAMHGDSSQVLQADLYSRELSKPFLVQRRMRRRRVGHDYHVGQTRAGEPDLDHRDRDDGDDRNDPDGNPLLRAAPPQPWSAPTPSITSAPLDASSSTRGS